MANGAIVTDAKNLRIRIARSRFRSVLLEIMGIPFRPSMLFRFNS
jgi:hypothetical protein